MNVDLSGFNAKLDRAAVHLDALQAEHDEFFDLKHGPVFSTFETEETDTKGTWRVMWLDNFLRAFPSHWGLIAGDAIHNIRSSLDHLVCALVVANGKKISRSHQFPIYGEQPDDRQKGRITDNLRGMDEAHAGVIRANQPFINPRSDSSRCLVMIQKLDNLDKHQAISPIVVIPSGIVLTGLPNAKYQLRVNRGKPLVPGSMLWAFPADLQIRDEVKGAVQTRIAFELPYATIERLRECLVLVKEFGEAFRRLGP